MPTPVEYSCVFMAVRLMSVVEVICIALCPTTPLVVGKEPDDVGRPILKQFAGAVWLYVQLMNGFVAVTLNPLSGAAAIRRCCSLLCEPPFIRKATQKSCP